MGLRKCSSPIAGESFPGSSALPSLAHPCWAEISTIKMLRREKPAKSNQTTTDPTMIPQWRVPKFPRIVAP